MTVRSLRRPVALAGAVALLLGACSGGATSVPSHAPSPATSAAASTGTGSTGCPTSAPAPMAAADTATVTLATAKGNIVIKVTGSLAPNATGNFVALAACGFYDGVVFHRLMPGFVIQAGDGQYGRAPNLDAARIGTGGPGYTIMDDPVTTPYRRGTVAMARIPAPNSQGSQFFIVLTDGAAPALAAANPYAIMGEVTSGMDVVDTIAAMPNSGGQEGLALEPVAITKVTVTRP